MVRGKRERLTSLACDELTSVLSALSSGTGANISDTSLPFPLPGDPGDLITDYPEGWVVLQLVACIKTLKIRSILVMTRRSGALAEITPSTAP